jgi:hypothetical protein
MATYSGFTNCMQNLAACHGIFYVKSGIIDHVSAVGTGGMRLLHGCEFSAELLWLCKHQVIAVSARTT